MSNIARITLFQQELLVQAAAAEVPIFALPAPNQRDDMETVLKMGTEDAKARGLVHLGLVEDVSEEFEDQIIEHTIRTGRKIKVYGLTETGYLMFKDSTERPSN